MSGIGTYGIGTSPIGGAIGYVNVPNAPGVPAVRTDPLAPVVVTPSVMTVDSPGVASGQQNAKWGIFDANGNAVISPDSVIDVSFDREFRISDYPVEQGGFQSYNKVATPFDFRMTMTKGGPANDLQLFIEACDSLVETDALYTAIGGNIAYPNVNVVRYGYERKSTNGVTLLTVHMFMREVRQTASATFSNTAAPDGADPVSDGNVQASTPTTAQTNTLGVFNPEPNYGAFGAPAISLAGH